MINAQVHDNKAGVDVIVSGWKDMPTAFETLSVQDATKLRDQLNKAIPIAKSRLYTPVRLLSQQLLNYCTSYVQRKNKLPTIRRAARSLGWTQAAVHEVAEDLCQDASFCINVGVGGAGGYAEHDNIGDYELEPLL